MSYCSRCGQIYASSWQSDRCCSFTSVYDIGRENRQKRNYRNHRDESTVSTREQKFWIVFVCAIIGFMNPFLAVFLFVIMMMC